MLALLVVALFGSVAQPTLLIGVPYLALAFVLGVRRGIVLAVGMVALLIAFVSLPVEGGRYLDLAWALLLGGCFAALTVRRPQSAFSDRALGAVAGAAGLTALMLGVRRGAWGAVQWVVQDRMTQGAAAFMEGLRMMRGGRGVPQALVSTLYDVVDKQILVFPAMLGLASFAALGVAWWVYVRLTTDSDGALRPLRSFRFNDHLVWVLIGGVVLLVLRADGLTRVGANAVVFMGGLYAVRGAAVVLFLTGGLSVFGYILLVVGALLLPPLVPGLAAVIGIGDTWLDVRKRVSEARARHNDS
ncbi:MAG: YybS family protein [Gemmatimonadetes bacterium]|nr:YybS family protein [Gemmatimonadota bacterium]